MLETGTKGNGYCREKKKVLEMDPLLDKSVSI